MSTQTLVSDSSPLNVRLFVRDVVALFKPRITVMVLLTAAAGLYLAPVAIEPQRGLLLLLGTVLVVAGANALNMYLERDIDGRARRTRNRPLPAGRLHPTVALVAGGVLGIGSLPLLALGVNMLTGLLGFIALFTYVAIYTPMKQRSPGALVVGAVPGAMPPLMGWTAATGRLDLAGLALFAIMFLWQLPHFLAITLYRAEEYENAGYKITATEHGILTAKVQIVLYLAALCPVTLLLVPLGVGGPLYLWTALLAGVGFFVLGACGLRRAAGMRWARTLFSASLLYLTVLMAALCIGQAASGGAPTSAVISGPHQS
jgi:protoheme IX farnesyltransferase